MDQGLYSHHPLSQFDLAAIGLVLIAVMAFLTIRRIARWVIGYFQNTPERSQAQDDAHR